MVLTSIPVLSLYTSFAIYFTTTFTVSILVISVNGINVSPLGLTFTDLEAFAPT